MADKTNVPGAEGGEAIVAKAKDFWEKFNRPLMIVCAVIIVAVGGYFIYKKFFKDPNEEKAADMLFKPEEYYRLDSAKLALDGDGQYPGLLKVIDKYGSTDAGNLACYYAGSCFIKLGENDKAIKYLKKFSSSSKPVQARAYKLIGDASADLGKNSDALDYYKKAAHYFEKDETNASEYLFLAAYFADRVMKDPKEAIPLYKELKQKFPRTQHGFEADNYLAQLGVYHTDD